MPDLHQIDYAYLADMLDAKLKGLRGLRSNMARGMPHYETLADVDAQILKAQQQYHAVRAKVPKG